MAAPHSLLQCVVILDQHSTHHLTMAEGAHNITQLILILNRTEENVKTLAVESDKFFLIVMSIIIFFMQCGFAFLEAGSVRYYMNVFH